MRVRTSGMKELFRYSYTVRFHDTDPAGIVFFAHIFRIAHEAYEAWMEHVGLPLGGFVQGPSAGLPIAGATAKFRRPLILGQRIEVIVSTARAGRTSFSLAYELVGSEGEVLAQLETTHVHVNQTTHRPAPVPEEILAVLRD